MTNYLMLEVSVHLFLRLVNHSIQLFLISPVDESSKIVAVDNHNILIFFCNICCGYTLETLSQGALTLSPLVATFFVC